jgi:predicted nucleotidyltransferase component of viral defense system
MSSRSPTNLAASVRQRLLNLSRSKGENYELVLMRYVLERFLYRLSISEYADRFVLKGAMLFITWSESPYRPTRDLDFLGYGDSSDQELIHVFQKICNTNVESDGLIFNGQSIEIEEIREQEEYDGRRVKLDAYLSKSRVRIQIDIGFGDAVTPEPSEIDYPTLLEFPPPRIKAYPMQSFVSEKLQAMVALGMANSRMKDFYDIWMIARQSHLDGKTLVGAIKATFIRRATDIPKEIPAALGEEFATNVEKSKQWQAFLARVGKTEAAVDFLSVINELREFAMQPLIAAANDLQFDKVWRNGAWQ